LFVEDSQDDVELQLRRLHEARLDPQWDRVESEEALRAALADESWHIALVDYNIPGFSGLEALHLIAELAPDLPAITVSGSIDEDTAVATMSAGAVDYVLKDNLTRLPPAVRRAVDGADLRRAHRRAAESASLALFAVDNASLSIGTMAADGTLIYVNDLACRLFGGERGDLIGKKLWEVDHGMKPDAWQRLWDRAVQDGVAEFRVDGPGPDGRRLVMDMTANHLAAADILVSYGRDITARVEAEERVSERDAQVRESETRFRSLAEQVPGFVTIKDSDGRYLYLSSLWGAVDEGAKDGWLGKRPDEVWPEDVASVSNAAAASALAGDMVDETITMRRGDEVKYFHSLHFPIVRDGASPLVGGLMIDVTDQVHAQEEVRRQAEQLRRTVEGAVLAMSQIVETRDPYTAGHERRVAELATAIGRELGLGAAELDGLRLGSLIHDIGKIAVPAEILAKPGRLSPVEFNLIKQHAQAGYEILSVIDFGRPVATMVLQHHERLDGSGYPDGLTGDRLLLETRILSVADVVEAMSSHRPYRAALGADAALAEIREGAGVRYDPDVVAACERVMVAQGFRFTP
jgi:PAS domain S-box-containing protein/putative nucleotidyltransferase with HDIG domain